MDHEKSDWTELQTKLEVADLQSWLPYATIEKDLAVTLKDGSLTAGIEIFPPHLDMMGKGEINGLQRQMVNLLNGLPDGVTIQFDMFSSTDVWPQLHKHYKENEEFPDDQEVFLIERELTKNYYASRMRDGSLRYWRNFVFINYHEPTGSWRDPKKMLLDMVKNISKGVKKGKVVQDSIQEYQIRLEHLTMQTRIVKSALDSMSMMSAVMDEEDWAKLLFHLCNPRLHELGAEPDMEGIKTDTDRDLTRTCMFSQIKEKEAGGFLMDGYHHKIFTLPEIKAGRTLFGIMRILANARIPNMRLTVIGKPTDPKDYLNEIRKDIRGLRNEQTNKKAADNVELTKAVEDRLHEQEELLQGIQKVFETRIVLHVWDKDEKKLEQHAASFSKIGQEMGGARWLEETFNSVPYFFSSLPGWTNDIDRCRLNDFKSYTFVDMLPIFGQIDPSAGLRHTDKGIQAPTILETQNMEIAGWAPIDNQRGTNLNGIIIGRTRSGKSVAQTHINTMMLPLFPRVTCIDLGASNKTLIESLGGVHYAVIDPTGQRPKCINPFGGAPTDRRPTDDEIRDYLYVVEQMLVSQESPIMESENRAVLEKALIQTFANNPGREIFLTNLHSSLINMSGEKARTMANILTTWVSGTYAAFVNGPSQVNLDNAFVGFEMGGIEQRPDLLPVLVAVILNHAKRMANQHPGVPKIVWIDEFAVLGKNPVLAKYTEIAYRTYGKTGTGVWTLSQQIIDYALCAPGGKIETFLNNVGQMVIFAQEEAAIESLREHTSLSEAALDRVSRLRTVRGQYSEALLVQKQQTRDNVVGSVVYRSNPIKYWLSSSSKNDTDVRYAVTERFMANEKTHQRALQRAILHLAENYPMGYDQSGLGDLTPKVVEAMSKPQRQDEAHWDPLESNFAKTLGLNKSKPPQYAKPTSKK